MAKVTQISEKETCRWRSLNEPLCEQSCVGPVTMSNVIPLLSREESEIEKFIDENLSLFQVSWLTMQSQALGHTRTRIFEAILSDWFSRRPSRNRQGTPDSEIARQAVEEFILRYQSRSFFRR